ncbi:hypothetical protein M758_2G111700 [Ceratodon purpureus]|nr:hypothetical protein M758_2G111700 [Ceratodon purpureus]
MVELGVMMAKRSQLQSCRKALLLAGCHQNFFLRSVQTVAPADAIRTRPIPVCVAPTVEEFVNGCYQAQTPMVIRGAMETWASRKWTPESLKEKFGHLNVPVELGFWKEEEGRYGDYRDLYQESITHAGSKEYFMAHQPMSLTDFIDIFMCKREDSSSPPPLIGYMAQHQLLTEVPGMANDIPDPDYVKAQRAVYQRNIWLGPAGTISPLHFDPYHNILAQIWGTKHIRLYAPEESSRLYPFTSSMFLRNTSQLNPEDLNASKKWPEFEKAQHWDCELRAGEMLYIPLKWWHYVRAVSNSLSASFWWL